MRWYGPGAVLVWQVRSRDMKGPLFLKMADGMIETLSENANRTEAEKTAEELRFARIGIADDLAEAADTLVVRAESARWDAADVLQWQERCGWASPEAITANRHAEEIVRRASELAELCRAHAREVTTVPRDRPPDLDDPAPDLAPNAPRPRVSRHRAERLA